MIEPIPSATYRIQLRGDVTFATVEQQLPYLRRLGISHLYLSPIFAAASGSTHGYDVLDPTIIEPALGGREGFERLARAAHALDIGVILDIVPNHTAFALENTWLSDVLRNGRQSRYAACFDIDWSAGPLVLPLLPEPFALMLARGDFSVSDGHWRFGDIAVPLAEGSSDAKSTDALVSLHNAQHWRLQHWETERDGITHRRFFNVTSLIGMRVDDPAVFDATHSLIVELVRAGLVDGLRVDHIDGLADPKAYLERLARAVPDTPVWVEKILVGTEALDQTWKTVGTTGYEAARLIARLLTRADGIETLDAHWRAYTGIDEDFSAALTVAKLDILRNELAAELHQLVALASAALIDDPQVEPGPEGLREAVSHLLLGMPRYRTYIAPSGTPPADQRLLHDIAERAGSQLRSSRIIQRLAHHAANPATPSDRRFVERFQQVSGALLAKAQEDTAGFRWTRFIAANEVGAEPEEPVVNDAEANAFLADRRPTEMTLTSSHDTKRSEDSRMRLVAISHHPDAFSALVDDADRLAPDALSRRWRWYIVQSALALWGEEPDVLAQRLCEHNQKAMREAKLDSFWTRPDEAVESAADRFVDALCHHWLDTRPPELARLIETGAALSLAQLALKCLLPGFPDIYRGGEGAFFALTDPDNRRPVDWRALENGLEAEGFGGEKSRLTRLLLALRQAEAGFLASASAEVAQSRGILLRRSSGARTLTVTLGATPSGTPFWQSGSGSNRLVLAWA